jgi:hypothetical protein
MKCARQDDGKASDTVYTVDALYPISGLCKRRGEQRDLGINNASEVDDD